MDERELQDFVAQTIAPFKVPRRIVLVHEIPNGATGKVQRTSLARQLQVVEQSPPPVMTSAFLEEGVRAIWGEVLDSQTSILTLTSSLSVATRSSEPRRWREYAS